MLRSSVLKSYDSEALDDVLISLQERGCSITEVRSVELNTNRNNISLKCNGFLILYDDPYASIRDSSDEEETEEPDDEDLTNEEKFFRDWGRRPSHAEIVGSMTYDEYLCPTNFGIPVDQKAYNIETGLCIADESACHNCAERFWKSKYKKPEEVN